MLRAGLVLLAFLQNALQATLCLLQVSYAYSQVFLMPVVLDIRHV